MARYTEENNETANADAKRPVERSVMCYGATERCCAILCPHSKPHAPHKPRQTEWDGEELCTAVGWCDGTNGKGRNMQCQCVDC